MKTPYTLFGWHLSYFSGKVMCYLRYKQIPFEYRQVNMFTLLHKIKKHTGAVVMPVLVNPEGDWLQDSSVIMDVLEQQFPALPVVPATPVQRFAASLMEAWGDEWWVPVAMHTRWSYPENYSLFEREAGAALLPHFPAWLQRRAVGYVAATLRSYLPDVGVRSEQFTLMEQSTLAMLDLLEAHFAVQPFLFGDHPTTGDFGLVGSMYAHLGRDPWPAREWIAPRPHLHAWIERMAQPQPPVAATLLPQDQIAATLNPVFAVIFHEFVPMLAAINSQLKSLLKDWPAGKILPRRLDEIEFPMGQGRFKRKALPYTLWMVQRTLDCYAVMTSEEQQQVRHWLQPLGGEALLNLTIPRLERCGLRVKVVHA